MTSANSVALLRDLVDILTRVQKSGLVIPLAEGSPIPDAPSAVLRDRAARHRLRPGAAETR
jgi:hypothetical protein